jgi:hypothetical protein
MVQENSATRYNYSRAVYRKNPVLDGHSLLYRELNIIND